MMTEYHACTSEPVWQTKIIDVTLENKILSASLCLMMMKKEYKILSG